jgi:hypothetical protein
VSTERVVYLGIIVAATFWAVLSAVMLLASPHERDQGGAWFWASVFVGSSLAAAWCFWELLGGAA